jgi:hypothetical protein
MYTELFQYKNLPEDLKKILNQNLDETRIVYVIKDNSGSTKSITTSVTHAIKKIQSV